MPINTATNPATGYIAIDQGTTSSRAILFDVHFAIIHIAQQPFDQHYPKNGWVEHDPEAIWQTVQAVTQEALSVAHSKGMQVKHIGIVNQRETTLVWHRETGKCVYPAIVWQDRRTRDICKGLKPHEQMVQSKTGLRLDPYFSASKVSWILDNVPGARAQAEQGELLFGTVDSFLIWRLTEGRVHATDVTNASRTCLFNINTTNWDPALLSLFNVPASMLPTVKDCADDFGTTTHFDAPLHISGVAGDQQAALIGQGCVRPGNVKATYGTGCFALVNTGTQCDINQHNLLTTLAYRIKGQTHYAVEGSIFIAGAAVQWLRDGIQLITHAADSEQIASEVDDEHGLVVVPAFTGLGAPYWEPAARGAIFGISRATTAADIVRATLESVCYQTNDLLEAMSSGDIRPSVLKVDGGMVANSWFCQHLANILNTQVVRPVVMETTALGAALLAAIQAGQLSGLDAIQNANPTECTFNPEGNDEQRQQRLAQWKQAVSATLLMAQHA